MTDSSGTTGSGDGPFDIGSVAEEAAKLVDALSEWAKDSGAAATGAAGAVAGLADLARDIEGHVGGENCTYCPLCRLVGIVRATSPEVKGHLATATTALFRAAASAMATHPPDASGPRRQGVERIDLEEPDGSSSQEDGRWD